MVILLGSNKWNGWWLMVNGIEGRTACNPVHFGIWHVISECLQSMNISNNKVMQQLPRIHAKSVYCGLENVVPCFSMLILLIISSFVFY